MPATASRNGAIVYGGSLGSCGPQPPGVTAFLWQIRSRSDRQHAAAPWRRAASQRRKPIRSAAGLPRTISMLSSLAGSIRRCPFGLACKGRASRSLGWWRRLAASRCRGFSLANSVSKRPAGRSLPAAEARSSCPNLRALRRLQPEKSGLSQSDGVSKLHPAKAHNSRPHACLCGFFASSGPNLFRPQSPCNTVSPLSLFLLLLQLARQVADYDRGAADAEEGGNIADGPHLRFFVRLVARDHRPLADRFG